MSVYEDSTIYANTLPGNLFCARKMEIKLYIKLRFLVFNTLILILLEPVVRNTLPFAVFCVTAKKVINNHKVLYYVCGCIPFVNTTYSTLDDVLKT